MLASLNRRDPRAAAGGVYDLVIVGGGAYGIMLALEAARRRMRPLLIERDDFGAATSWNSLRIVHGGLRYLQALDLHRFRESVGERSWFLRHFPDLVEPLRCLMPLYGDGLRRPQVLRAALAVNDALSRRRNRALRADRVLPDGEVLTAEAVAALFPAVDRTGLHGGALWYDGVMLNSQRLLIEALRWACSYGARALNYVEAGRLRLRDGRVDAVEAVDRETGDRLEFRAPVVVNCAGPWSEEVARRLDGRAPHLFPPSLAFNLLLDRRPPSDAALAVTPRRSRPRSRPRSRTYFMYPWHGRVLVGTFHAPWSGAARDARPSEEQIGAFLDDLNAAVPDWGVRREDVLRVLSGTLPAAEPGSDALAVREVIYDHGRHGGARGLYSVSGVKFTTARLVASKVLRVIEPGLSRDPEALAGTERPVPVPVPDRESFERLRRRQPAEAAALVSRLAREEQVVRLDDLLLRRTDWAMGDRESGSLAAAVQELLARAPSLEPPIGAL